MCWLCSPRTNFPAFDYHQLLECQYCNLNSEIKGHHFAQTRLSFTWLKEKRRGGQNSALEKLPLSSGEKKVELRETQRAVTSFEKDNANTFSPVCGVGNSSGFRSVVMDTV
jgi:hypothetical protein